MTNPDKQVVSKAMFEEALPALRPVIHRYCSRMMGSVIDGEDILQIAFMKAFEALEGVTKSSICADGFSE